MRRCDFKTWSFNSNNNNISNNSSVMAEIVAWADIVLVMWQALLQVLYVYLIYSNSLSCAFLVLRLVISVKYKLYVAIPVGTCYRSCKLTQFLRWHYPTFAHKNEEFYDFDQLISFKVTRKVKFAAYRKDCTGINLIKQCNSNSLVLLS